MNKFIYAIALAALMVSCSSATDDPPIDRGEERIIQADLEGVNAGSRSCFLSDGAFFWTKDENISVYKSSGNFRQYTLSTGAGTNSGVFQGGNVELEYSETCAVMPFGSHSVSGSTLNFVAAAEYTYQYETGEFFVANNGEVNSCNAAMLSKIDNENPASLHFKFMGGVFCFKIMNIPAGCDRFVFKANSKINGRFMANLEDEYPVITTESSDMDTEKQITIRFTASSEAVTRTFYVPMPTGTYEGFSYEIYNGEEKKAAFSSTATNEITRGRLLMFPTISCDNMDTSSKVPGFSNSDI